MRITMSKYRPTMDVIVEFVRAHAGASADAIARAVGISQETAARLLGILVDQDELISLRPSSARPGGAVVYDLPERPEPTHRPTMDAIVRAIREGGEHGIVGITRATGRAQRDVQTLVDAMVTQGELVASRLTPDDDTPIYRYDLPGQLAPTTQVSNGGAYTVNAMYPSASWARKRALIASAERARIVAEIRAHAEHLRADTAESVALPIGALAAMIEGVADVVASGPPPVESRELPAQDVRRGMVYRPGTDWSGVIVNLEPVMGTDMIVFAVALDRPGERAPWLATYLKDQPVTVGVRA